MVGILHEQYAVRQNPWTFEKVVVTVPEPPDYESPGPATGDKVAPKPF
jgi:hypothetical protein